MCFITRVDVLSNCFLICFVFGRFAGVSLNAQNVISASTGLSIIKTINKKKKMESDDMVK